jgi:hypothetical protein
MFSITRRAALIAGALTLSLSSVASLALTPRPALAAEVRAGTIVVSQPWTRATPPGAQAAGGYLQLTNTGSAPDRLIGASFAAARNIEMHEMAHANGVMTMREIQGGIPIPPGQTVTLQPGGLHVMFLGLTQPLKEGESIAGSLTFERAGTVAVNFTVGAMGARGAVGQQGHGHQGRGGHGGHGHHGAHGGHGAHGAGGAARP